jgi:hypothetical protein
MKLNGGSVAVEYVSVSDNATPETPPPIGVSSSSLTIGRAMIEAGNGCGIDNDIMGLLNDPAGDAPPELLRKPTDSPSTLCSIKL